MLSINIPISIGSAVVPRYLECTAFLAIVLHQTRGRAWFLVHFGAVMAINPLAHALLPELPMASLAEVVDVVG